MNIAESIGRSSEVQDSFLEAAINEEDHERLLSMMRKKALAMDKMDRAQLLAFVKTLLSVRNCLVEKEQDRGVEIMQEMASGVLRLEKENSGVTSLKLFSVKPTDNSGDGGKN